MVQMRMEGFKKIHEDMERVIEKDDTTSSVTTDSEEGKPVARNHREKICHILHSQKFQIGIVILVIFDCLLVIVELMFDLEVLKTDHDNPAPHILHYMSIGVLCIFLVEIIVKFYAMGLEFFTHKLEVFDAIVVITALALDIAYVDQEGLSSAAGFLIVLRLWRLTRILNGMILSVKAQAERRLARERAIREAVEQELSKFREYCSAQENEIEALQDLLRKNGIEFEKVERPVMGRTIDVVAEVNEFTEKLQDIDLNGTTNA